MAKKRKEKQMPDNLLPDEETFIANVSDEAFFSDSTNFIEDIPYVRPINEKFDEDGLYLMHHYLICHLAIVSGYYPKDNYPTTKDKCLQYHADRGLSNLLVNVLTFYKSYSDFVNTYMIGRYTENVEAEKDESDNHKDEREIEVKSTKQKEYLSYKLIDESFPLLEMWYPNSRLFIQTLKHDPYRLDTLEYYWVYREILSKYDQSMRQFVEDNCPHIGNNTFKSIHLRHFKDEIPSHVKDFISPYIAAHYPKALE